MRTLSIVAGAVALSALAAGQTPNALSVYKDGDYDRAIPLLKEAAKAQANDAALRAALLSALVYQGKVEEAVDAAEEDAQVFPDSPDVIAACGEYAFYMGEMTDAERLFRQALKMRETTARAYYGMSRLFYAASMRRSARVLCLRAHEIDPDDALITRLWMTYLVPEKRRELLPAFMAAHPWLYQHGDAIRGTQSEVSHELNGRKTFEPEGERQETTLHLLRLMRDANHIEGVGLEFRIGDARPLHLLYDTGASGILIDEKSVDKAGLNHLGSTEAFGIGDAGKRKVFMAVSDTCEVGGIKFKTCVVAATEGKQHVSPDIDGLIGADFFASYLQEIDFQRFKLHLIPLPARPPNPQGYDREISADEKDFTPIFRFGHQLMISTKLNGKTSGLFLLDTGSTISNVDSTFARLSTKVRGTSFVSVRGISGQVKNVFEADRAELEFGHYRQANLGLIAFDLNNRPDHEEVRMSGILGLPVLSLFRLTLDYRNGLVKFEYILGEKKK